MREACAEAPGRVNLIGEHTDYHDGWVLPFAIPQRTIARIGERRDREVHATSTARPDEDVQFVLGREARTGTWADYVQGVTAVLAASGYGLGGFNLELSSTVPLGSGLSSSAALEVALLRALRSLFLLSLSDLDIARIGQRTEVEFVGAPVGIMDQMASSLAAPGEALLLDTRSLAFERIPLPPAIDFIVIDSGVTHEHASGSYVTRRRESEAAARLLAVEKLRDVDVDRLSDLSRLPSLLARRARHVITENARVLAARAPLAAGDLLVLGRLLCESHASLRDDYEVSAPRIDRLVELALADDRVAGARMTGGGFGGSIVAVAERGTGKAAGERIVDAYNQLADARAALLLPR